MPSDPILRWRALQGDAAGQAPQRPVRCDGRIRNVYDASIRTQSEAAAFGRDETRALATPVRQRARHQRATALDRERMADIGTRHDRVSAQKVPMESISQYQKRTSKATPPNATTKRSKSKTMIDS